MGSTLAQQKAYREAEKILAEAVIIKKRLLGPAHRTTIADMRRLGTHYKANGYAVVLYARVL